MNAPTAKPTPNIDHAAAADAVARAYSALARLDHLLARSGAPSWTPPRVYSMEAFAGLQRVGDALAEAAGPGLRAVYRVPAAVAAAPKAPAAEITGPSPRQTDTGIADRGPSLQQGDSLGPSTASAVTTRDAETDPRPCYSEDGESSIEPQWASQGHKRVAAQMDVQTQSDANGAATREQGERASTGGGPTFAAAN